MTFDFFAISVILSKYKQDFSKASYTISVHQNNLSNNIVEEAKIFWS